MSDSDVKEKYEELLESLKTQRDELSVKMHLANMELQDEWHAIEDKWQHFQSKAVQVEKEIGSSSHDVADAFTLLGQELRDSYRRIRKLL